MAAAEDKFKILEEKIKATPELNGALVIKVSRKSPGMPGGVAVPQLICTLGNASVAHVLNPELWLPRLFGGGRYTMIVYPTGVATSPLLDNLEIDLQGDTRAQPDWDAVEESTWEGPRDIRYPPKRDRDRLKDAPGVPFSIASPPSATTPNTAAAQQPSSGTGGSGVTLQDEIRRQEELKRVHDHYNAQLNALHAQTQALNQRLAEEQHERKLEAIQAANKQEMERLRRELQETAQKIQQSTPPPRGFDLGEILEKAAPVLAPLVTLWVNASQEREKRAEERDRRAEERQAEVLKMMTTRPVIDPVIKELMDQRAASELPMSAILQQSAQATAAVMGTMSDMMIKFAEANAGPEEDTMIRLAREVGGAIQGIVRASAPAKAGPRRLPPQNGATVPPPQSSAPQPSAAFNDLGAIEPKPVSLAELREMLIAKGDPDRVARFVIASAESPEFEAAFQAANGESFKMFETLMGEAWIKANVAYVAAFSEALNKYVQGEEPEEDVE